MNDDSLVNLPEEIEPSNKKESRWQWLLSPLAAEAAILLLIFSAIAIVLSRTVADPDLWGHLRFGLDNLEAGKIIRSDSYSYTAAGQAWMNHEWLAELMFGLAWNAAGQTGLVLLKILAWLATMAIITGYLLTIGMSAVRTGFIVIATLFVMLPAAVTIRPQMFTALGFALTVLAIVLAEDGELRWLWGLPVVFALWANLHGGFVAGLLYIVIWAVVFLFTHRRYWKQVLPPILLGLLATLLNPYGIELLTFLGRTATVSRPEIIEWSPINIISLMGIGYILAVGLTLLALANGRPRMSISRLTLLVIAILLPLIAQRHIVLFAIAVPLLAGPVFLSAWPGKERKQSRGGRWFVIIPILAGIMLLILTGTRLERIEPPSDKSYPLTTVALLKQSEVSGNLALHFNWGEYAIWHLSPRIKVSMDGRRETVYPEDLYQSHLNFTRGVSDWNKWLSQYPTDLVLIPRNSAAENLLNLMPEWRSVAQDEVSRLYARAGSPQEAQLLAAIKNFESPPAGFP